MHRETNDMSKDRWEVFARHMGNISQISWASCHQSKMVTKNTK